jgi:hypothetical protein
MKLIDVDALKKFPIRIDRYDKEHGNEDFVLGIETVLEYAEHLPTVDAVPVVRCKDCEGWESKRGRYGCCEYFNKHTYSDDFCSYGERRTDG